jgi:hypothetical protein
VFAGTRAGLRLKARSGAGAPFRSAFLPEGSGPRPSTCWGRVHGHDNLYVVDASVHVTNGSVNPVLTIMALAFRAAERLCAEW